MKKRMLVIAVLLFAITTSYAQTADFSKQEKPKVYWKHHDCSWQGGFCVRHIFSKYTPGETLNPGEGTFNYDLINGQFVIVFDGTGGPVNGIFPVDADVVVGSELAGTLGYSSFNLVGGDYVVDYSNRLYPYGFVSINCTVVR